MRKATIVAAVLAVGGGMFAAAPAQAVTEVTVFKNQTYQPDTRSGGTVTFPVGGGVRLQTASNTSQDKATFAFATGENGMSLDAGLISHDVNVKSGGDLAIPGVQVYLGSDALDTTPGALLVYEEAYGDDLWLPGGQPAAYKQVAPSCDNSNPAVSDGTKTSDQLIAEGICTGGGGSAWHGSQTAWTNALLAAGLDRYVSALGESLGSGVKGNVLVSTISHGDVTYEFSRKDAPVVEPEPTIVNPYDRIVTTLTASCRQVRVQVSLPAPGPNEEYSASSIRLRIGNQGTTQALATAQNVNVGGSVDRTFTYNKGSGSAALRLLVNRPEVLENQIAVNKNCNTVGAGPVTTTTS